MSTLIEDAMALPADPRWDNSNLDFGIWVIANHAKLIAYAAELKAFAALPPSDFFEWAVEIHLGQMYRSQQRAFNDAARAVA